MARERDFGTAPTNEQLATASIGFDFGADDSGDDAGTGDVDSSGERFDPERHVGRDQRKPDGTFKRKRGRRAGTGGGSTGREKKTATSVSAIEQSLIGIHALLAAATRTPELVLEADESKPLAVAVAELAKHYDLPGLDAKTTAWVGLIMVCGQVYVPRAVMIKQRLDAEAKERKPSNVVQLPKQEPQKQRQTKQSSKQQPQEIDPLSPPLGFPV